MKSLRRILSLAISLVLAAAYAYAGPVKVTITGTLPEPVVMTFDGATQTIYDLPFEIYVDKKKLPIKAKFQSENYEYHDITFNKKEEDGRFYILHSEKKAVAQAYQPAQSEAARQEPSDASSGRIDTSIDVNNVPMSKKQANNTFALIIANEDYESAQRVDMAKNDGLVFKEYCVKTLGIPETCVKYYTNATFGQMTKAFRNIDEIAKAFNGDINLIVYYAGHGIPDNATKDAYLMPIDSDGTDLDICFSLNKLYKTIDEMHLPQAVVFLDACFSGAQRDGGMIVAARGVKIAPKEAEPVGTTIVFSATSGEEAAYAYKDRKHGMFTYFLLKALQNSKGDVKLGDLIEEVTKNVKQNSVMVNGVVQTPNVVIPPAMMDKWKDIKLVRK